jgi:hypothetical protein
MLWESTGKENTQNTVKAAAGRARELGIEHIVVASNTGETAKLVLKEEGIKVICVSHHVGFSEPGHDEMPSESRQYFREKGVPVLTTTHVLAGIGRAISGKFGGVDGVQMIAHTLRLFGQGTKVAVEIATMALDAGLIPYGQKIVSIGGSQRGADTALVLTPAHARDFFDTKIHEIICKPRL